MSAETIAAITALVVALGALGVAWNNSRSASAAAKEARDEAAAGRVEASRSREAAEDASREIVLTKKGLFTVGEAIDGRLTALLEATARLERATGRAEGIAAEQERVATGAASIPASPTPVPVTPPPSALPAEPAAPIEVRVVQEPQDPALRVKDIRQ